MSILFVFIFFKRVYSDDNKNNESVNKGSEDISDCERQNPIFSYVYGRPNISAVPGSAGLIAVLISWDMKQVLYAPTCVDAFEVEFQQVGGSRLSWSPWSAMVGCAPTREPREREEFASKRKLEAAHCSTRQRFRVMPHNSRYVYSKKGEI